MENGENRCGDGVFWSFDREAACIVISGNGKMKNFEEISEVPWYPHLGAIRKVVIEKGVTSVGDWAFCSCENLTDLILADTVETLGVQCFSCCTSLLFVALPEGVRVIRSKAFRSCTSLTEVSLPVTLTDIDMRAFGKDCALTTVYYSGTRLQWEKIRISMSASDNQYLVQADIHCFGTPVDVTLQYQDVEKTDWFAAPLQYLADHDYLGEMNAVNSQTAGAAFGPQLSVDREFVLNILYLRAGSPGMYDSAAEWAENNGLISRKFSGAENEGLTLAELAVILYRTALANGLEVFQPTAFSSEAKELTIADARPEEALAWCRACGYFSGLPAERAKEALTRGEAASVLAIYLQNRASYANRYREIISEVKAALKQGGNGKMYLVVPDLSEPGITAKSGDCTVIVFPDGQTMMIDAGYMACSGHVISLLKDLELTYLDHVVLSHTHDDHSGGLMAVAQYIYGFEEGYIGSYYRSACVFSTTEPPFFELLQENGTRLFTNIKAGEKWSIGGVTIEIFNPEEKLVESCSGKVEEVNNTSLLMKFTYGTSTYLTGGDLYQKQEAELASVYGDALKADVMKANHHGTHTSSCEQWIKTISPTVIFAPADDAGDSFFVRRAARLGIAYYSVGVDGLVMIRMDDSKNYKVVSQYDSPLRRNYRGNMGKKTNCEI